MALRALAIKSASEFAGIIYSVFKGIQ